jgi:hypothetical protein
MKQSNVKLKELIIKGDIHPFDESKQEGFLIGFNEGYNHLQSKIRKMVNTMDNATFINAMIELSND